MPTDDPNGAARRPVLKLVGSYTDQELRDLVDADKLWIFCGEYEAKGGETGGATAADLARHGNGPGVFQVFDAGSWGRGYWRG